MAEAGEYSGVIPDDLEDLKNVNHNPAVAVGDLLRVTSIDPSGRVHWQALPGPSGAPYLWVAGAWGQYGIDIAMPVIAPVAGNSPNITTRAAPDQVALAGDPLTTRNVLNSAFGLTLFPLWTDPSISWVCPASNFAVMFWNLATPGEVATWINMVDITVTSANTNGKGVPPGDWNTGDDKGFVINDHGNPVAPANGTYGMAVNVLGAKV